MKVLVVDDERRIANSVKQGLEQEGYAVDVAYDGEDGYNTATNDDYDIVILDVMMPGLDGLAVAEKLRADGKKMPILMLTALDGVEEQVKGFGAGADDYLPKPFDVTVLLARVNALIRRAHGRGSETLLVCGDLVMDHDAKRVTRADQPIKLSGDVQWYSSLRAATITADQKTAIFAGYVSGSPLQIYAVPLDGSALPLQLSRHFNPSIISYRLTDDNTRLLYTDGDHFYSSDLATGTEHRAVASVRQLLEVRRHASTDHLGDLGRRERQAQGKPAVDGGRGVERNMAHPDFERVVAECSLAAGGRRRQQITEHTLHRVGGGGPVPFACAARRRRKDRDHRGGHHGTEPNRSTHEGRLGAAERPPRASMCACACPLFGNDCSATLCRAPSSPYGRG